MLNTMLMKRKLIVKIWCFMAIIATIVACQQAPADNEIWYTTTNGQPLGLTVSSISDTYNNGRGVLKFNDGELEDFIKSGIFEGEQTLESVILPESVTSIGDGAFYHCSSLTSITIPESVTSIVDRAFSHCFSLTSITIPEGVTSIGEEAFEYCFSLTSITIPESVTSIGDDAFYRCESLTSITIPNSVISIGGWAFSGCSSLTSIEIPKSVTSIGSSAFDGTAWYDNLPDGVVYIGEFLYKYKGTMPANTSIAIKEGTTTICFSAFDGCSGLTSIEIPKSVTSIANGAFCGCISLTSITCLATTPPSCGHGGIGIAETTMIYVPKEAVKAYTDSHWVKYKNQIKPIE